MRVTTAVTCGRHSCLFLLVAFPHTLAPLLGELSATPTERFLLDNRLLIILRLCAGPAVSYPKHTPAAGRSLSSSPPSYPAPLRGQHPPGQYSATHCRPGVPPFGVSTDYLATNAHYGKSEIPPLNHLT